MHGRWYRLHIVDPRFPGAVDFIVNLGDYRDAEAIGTNISQIIALTEQISFQLALAYNPLKEAKCAYQEWGSYIKETINVAAACSE